MPIALQTTALDRIARARILFGHRSVGESLLTGVAEFLARDRSTGRWPASNATETPPARWTPSARSYERGAAPS